MQNGIKGVQKLVWESPTCWRPKIELMLTRDSRDMRSIIRSIGSDLMDHTRCPWDFSWPLDLMTKASMRICWTRSVKNTCSQSNMLHMAQSITSFQASNKNKINGNWLLVNFKTTWKMEGAHEELHLQPSDFKKLNIQQVVISREITHEFHFFHGHRCRLHTQEPLIGLEYGEFESKSDEHKTLIQKLNNEYATIEDQTIGLMICAPSWVDW